MKAFIVHDCMRTEDWGPIVAPEECRHPGHCQVPVALDTSHGDMRAEALFCAACGRESIRSLPWGDALRRLMAEDGQPLSVRTRMWQIATALVEGGRLAVRVPDDADERDRQVYEQHHAAPLSWFHWIDPAAGEGEAA